MTVTIFRKRSAIGLVTGAVALALGLLSAGAMGATAADPTASLRASPTVLTFDSVMLGGSYDAELTIVSSGTSAAAISGVSNVGRDARDFSVISETCAGVSLPPGARCTVTVRFSPTVAGTRVSNIRVSSTNACTLFVAMAGGGTAPAAGTTRKSTAACSVVTAPPTTITSPSATVVAPPTTVTTPGSTVVVPAPVVTTASSASPMTTTTTTTTVVVPRTTTIALPASKTCTSRRVFALDLRPPADTTYKRVVVRLNGTLLKTLTNVKSTSKATSLSLKGLPRGRFTLTIKATTTKGKITTKTKHYVTCVKSRG